MGQKTFSAEVKSRAALEAIKGEHTLSEISSKYGVHSSVVCRWKKEALEAVKSGFLNKRERDKGSHSKDVNELYQQIGRLKVENDFLKKSVYRF